MRLCECGCGLSVPTAQKTDRRRGHVKGQPLRFIHGHRVRLGHDGPRRDSAARRAARLARWEVIADLWRAGMTIDQIACEVGSTPNSINVTVSRMRREGFADLPYRFMRVQGDEEVPNPTGLCQCGCGAPTTLATSTARRRQALKGEPVRYLLGHGAAHSRVGEYEVDENGCWIWQHSLTAGYGYLKRDGETKAHRWYYRQHVGPIPAGYEVHHTCEVRACVNPAHLEPLTHAEHTRRHRKEVVDAAA